MSDVVGTTVVGACLDCGSELDGSYCAQCGMRDRWPRLDARDIFRDVIGNLFNFETTIWRTLIGLTLWPGRLARDYVAGQRRRHFNPFKYLLVSAAVGALLTWRMRAQIDVTSANDFEIADIDKLPFGEDLVAAFRASISGLLEIIQGWGRELSLLMLPLQAMAYRLVLRRYNFAETVCFTAYIEAHVALLSLLATLPWMESPANPGLLGSLVGAAVQALGLAYRIWAVRQFYE
ncbi:MAG: DUF3667 domain-containing protein, partial [Acidobacteriota bacterium]